MFIFYIEANQNSSAVALSSPQLEELEKKIAELNSMLSAELAYLETKVSELKRNMSLLKSSLVLKDGELNSSAFAIQERKEAYFHLEHKHVAITYTYDKLLAKFEAYCEVAEIF